MKGILKEITAEYFPELKKHWFLVCMSTLSMKQDKRQMIMKL